MPNKILSTIIVASLITVGTVTPTLTSPTFASAEIVQTDTASINSILTDVNKQRALFGLSPLKLDDKLNTIAGSWSEQQAANKTMAHNPNYTKEYTPGWERAGENVAYGFEVDTVVKGWMSSPGHKANILGQYSTTGIGMAYDEDGVAYYTQVFAHYPDKEPVATPPAITSHVALGVTNTTETSIALNIAHSRAQNGKFDTSTLNILSNNQIIQTISLAQSENTKTISGLDSNSEYTFEIIEKWKATDGISSDASSSVSITHSTLSNDESKIEVVSKPATKVTVLNPTQIQVDWTAPNIKLGKVENYSVITHDGKQIVNTKLLANNVNTIKVANLKGEQAYTVTVIANLSSADNTNKTTTTSNVVSVKTPSATKAEASKASVLTVSSVTPTTTDLSWNAPVISSGSLLNYTLKVMLNGKVVKTYTTPNQKFTASGLTPNTNYSYVVSANLMSWNGVTKASSNSNTVSKKTLINLVVNAPTKLTNQAVSFNTIKLSWVKPVVTGGTIKNYTVNVLSNNKVIKTVTVPGTATFVNVAGLVENTSYTATIKVNAATTDGQNKNVTSTFKAVKTPISPASQVNVSSVQNLTRTSLTPTSVTYTWTKPKVAVGTLKYVVRIQGGSYDKTFTNVSGKITVSGLPSSVAYKATITAHATSKNGLYTKIAGIQVSFTTPKPIATSDIQTILNETNAYRKAHGLPALKAHANLNTVSTNWSKTMASKKTMSHNPNVGKQIPANWRAWGENVAVGYTAATVTKAWYNSPGHKANMLNKRFTHIGIGIAYDSNGRAYFTQTFAQY